MSTRLAFGTYSGKGVGRCSGGEQGRQLCIETRIRKHLLLIKDSTSKNRADNLLNSRATAPANSPALNLAASCGLTIMRHLKMVQGCVLELSVRAKLLFRFDE